MQPTASFKIANTWREPTGPCKPWLRSRKTPTTSVLLPFGDYTAARMNAEQGRRYDVAKLVNWCFAGDTPSRGGDWGAVVGRWGEYDVSGLIGAEDRVFLMNTFDTASPLVPLVRYDPRFARAIGKWMLNAANAARLFYPDELPARYQVADDLKDAVKGVIAYEAISPNRNGQPIFADRDDWGPGTRDRISQFSLYGSSHAGIFGAIVRRTSDERILMLDCLATDFFRDKAYPTYLLFNPYPEDKEVRIDVGPKRVDLYDAVSHGVGENVCGMNHLATGKEFGRRVVMTPVGGKITCKAQKGWSMAWSWITAPGITVSRAVKPHSGLGKRCRSDARRKSSPSRERPNRRSYRPCSPPSRWPGLCKEYDPVQLGDWTLRENR